MLRNLKAMLAFLAWPLLPVFADSIPSTQPVYGPTMPSSQATSQSEESRIQIAPPLSFLEQCQSAIAGIVDQISPSVVAVQVDRRPDFQPRGPTFSAAGTATGAGVIIRKDGMILTSQHVIESAMAINIVLHDSRRLRARKIAADPRADLAILRIDAADLKPARLGDATSLRRGHFVLALGNPLGLASDGQAAVSDGIVSAIARPLPEAFGREEDRYYGDMIQTSVNVQPGNSGGPLINARGEVVGIVAATALVTGPSESIAFAVPIAPRTRAIIEALLSGEEVRYGYAGVRVGSLTEIAGGATRDGVYLATVFPDGPAFAAGLRAGDIILKLNGATVTSADNFIQLVGAAGPQQRVEVEYQRGKSQAKVTFALASRASVENSAEPIVPFMFRGAMLAALTPEARAAQHLPENCNLVLSIETGSPADRAGLTPGDIIIRVEGQPIESGELQQMTSSTHEVLLGLSNGGSFLVPATGRKN